MPIFDSYVLSVALFLVSMATEPQQHVSFKSSLENNAINKSGILSLGTNNCHQPSNLKHCQQCSL